MKTKKVVIKVTLYLPVINRRKKMYEKAIEKIRENQQENAVESAKNAAKLILKESGKNDTPVKIIEICKMMGFSVYKQELPREICGYIMINGELKDKFPTDRIISVNSNESNKRRRFTVAHELGHYLFDFDPTKSIQYFNMFEIDHAIGNEEEDRANRFAAELLMPEDLIKQKYSELKKGTSQKDLYSLVQNLSDIFLVPPKAVEMRIKEELHLHEA